MPAPLLRHYNAIIIGNTGSFTGPTFVTPAARALVVSKITVINNQSAALTFSLMVGATNGTFAYLIAANFPLNPGEIYTETGVVVLAGEGFSILTSRDLSINVFGEESDNG